MKEYKINHVIRQI